MRKKFLVAKNSSVALQTWTRGFQCRKVALRERKIKINEIRSSIIKGWEDTAVSLLQRSRLWKLLKADNPTYLDV